MSGAHEHFEDERLLRLQDRILKLERKLEQIPFAEGSLVSIEVATSPTIVNHRLGRQPRGVLVLSATPDAALGFSTTPSPDPGQAVYLEASATATFKLWFW